MKKSILFWGINVASLVVIGFNAFIYYVGQ